MMMLFGLQIKWNQNHHKTYTLRINEIFKFYPTWYLLPSSYIYTNCIVTCSVGWLNWDLTSHQQLRSYGCDKMSSIGIKKTNTCNFLG